MCDRIFMEACFKVTYCDLGPEGFIQDERKKREIKAEGFRIGIV